MVCIHIMGNEIMYIMMRWITRNSIESFNIFVYENLLKIVKKHIAISNFVLHIESINVELIFNIILKQINIINYLLIRPHTRIHNESYNYLNKQMCVISRHNILFHYRVKKSLSFTCKLALNLSNLNKYSEYMKHNTNV